MTPELCADILRDKLVRQITFFDRLLALSRRQKEAVDTGNEELLPGYLQEREAIMNRLTVLEKVQAAYRQYWVDNRTSFAPGQAREIQDRFSVLEQKLNELLCADGELKTAVQEKMSTIRTQIGAMRNSKRVVAAYGRPKLEARPRFVSKLSQ